MFLGVGVPTLVWCSGLRDVTAKYQTDCIYFGSYYTEEGNILTLNAFSQTMPQFYCNTPVEC